MLLDLLVFCQAFLAIVALSFALGSRQALLCVRGSIKSIPLQTLAQRSTVHSTLITFHYMSVVHYVNTCNSLQARFVSPFAFQPASAQRNEDQATPDFDKGNTPPTLSQSPIRPATHTQMVHRLSRELHRSELPSVLSRPADNRASESVEEGVSSTLEMPFSVGSNATASLGQRGHTVQKADTSAWDQLVRCQSLESPTASQLSMTQIQQAMTLMGRTESIRDRNPTK